MLGVITNPSDDVVVQEFFELFKTPWEVCRPGIRYDVVLCAADVDAREFSAKLLLVYAGERVAFDDQHGVRIQSSSLGAQLSFGETTVPIYGTTVRFASDSGTILKDMPAGESVGQKASTAAGCYVRLGYDLFKEVRTLLDGPGQPSQNASFPTLDLHIALLRRLITGSGLPLAEIPPVPAGYPFIACLTHDVDHASIRRHKFDRTMFGFLCRATVGSALKATRGRMSPGKLLTNWTAAAKLPFVYLGLASDFWYEFDRYLEYEQGRPSTFFFIPFAGRPGRSAQGNAPVARGAGYGVTDVAEKVRKLRRAGCEIGLHGIDAWTDSAKGREEANRIAEAATERPAGVRMHWLYWKDRSSEALEDAGFSYDSTVGYNETVGYRAGTTQVFKPLGASRLLELPLHIMDTALFYPSYHNLSDDEAWEWLGPFFGNASLYGGVMTVNWHDRSIAPERLWGNFYARLLGELTRRGALFSSAAQTVSWFRKRRSVVFERADDAGRICARVSGAHDSDVPGLRLRCHRAGQIPAASTGHFQENYTETVFDQRTEFSLING